MRSNEIEAYKQKLSLSPEQREALIGLILGDAHLETQNGGRTYRLKIEHGAKQRDYVEHLYQMFQDWVRTPPKEKEKFSRGGPPGQNIWFSTLSHGSFRFYAGQFYRGRRKIVPKLIARWLTPRGLAYWFMDDGSIKSKQSKGLILNTQAFARGEVARLVEVLQLKFGLQAKLRKQQDGWQIYISGRSYERFLSLVQPFLLPSFDYKLHARPT